MVPVTFLLSISAFVSAAQANPLVTIRDNGLSIPLTKHVNLTSGNNILASDQERAKGLRTRNSDVTSLRARASSVPVTNQAVIYTAALAVGSPPTTCMPRAELSRGSDMPITNANDRQLNRGHRKLQYLGRGCDSLLTNKHQRGYWGFLG